MKKQLFSEIKDKIHRHVARARLREAFALARTLSEGNMAWEISDALQAAEESYRRLLSYAVSGADDPSRDDMVAELGEKILTIVDRLDRLNTSREEPTLYYNTLRYRQTLPQETITTQLGAYRKACSEVSLLDLVASGTHSGRYSATTTEREQLERDIFNLIWTTFPLSRADNETISTVLQSGVLPEYAVSLFTWAIVMGGLEFFDPSRLTLLADIYSSSTDAGSERVSAVALIGLLLIMHRWRDRRLLRQLSNRIQALRELPSWKSDIGIAYMELVRTRDTDRISAKIRDEIVPEMMKLKPEFERKLSNNLAVADPEEMEENPEWQEMLNKSGLADKLKEMSEIQEEGGDIMMGTFQHLKQFPFFSKLPNWFIPFHSERSEFAERAGDSGMRDIAGLFEQIRFLCDSDKYSLLMSLTIAPAAQRDIVMKQLRAQADQLDEIRAAKLDLPADSRRAVIAREIQNLYRFFRLFRRKGEFANPFEKGVNLVDVAPIVEDVREPELLTLIAEFYFSHHYWPEALGVFEILDELDGPSAQIFQKIGHCQMKLGHTSDALNSFEKADMLDSRSPWVITRLARCHALLGHHRSALDACQRLEQLRPDRPATALAMGRAHLALEQYSEAVKNFFKAFYLDEKSPKAIRPLAWSLLMDKQFDQARKYYEKILTDFDPVPEDYLNMGHLSLATGNFPEATNFYRLSIAARNDGNAADTSAAATDTSAAGNDEALSPSEAFISDMRADIPALERLGIQPNLVPLIIDAILYES